MPKRDMSVPYQQAGQVRQLLAERANAEALGLVDRIAAVDKQLDALGFQYDEATPAVRRNSPPAGRSARHERTEKADEGDYDEGDDDEDDDERPARRRKTTA